MDEKITVKFLEFSPKLWNLVPGNFGDNCPPNGIHYDEDGRLIDFFCDRCPFWEQCERCDDDDEYPAPVAPKKDGVNLHRLLSCKCNQLSLIAACVLQTKVYKLQRQLASVRGTKSKILTLGCGARPNWRN